MTLFRFWKGGDDGLDNVEGVCKNKRAPILRTFVYRITCKLPEYAVKELQITLSACKEVRSLALDTLVTTMLWLP